MSLYDVLNALAAIAILLVLAYSLPRVRQNNLRHQQERRSKLVLYNAADIKTRTVMTSDEIEQLMWAKLLNKPVARETSHA